VGEKLLEEGMNVTCLAKTEKETTSNYKVYSITVRKGLPAKFLCLAGLDWIYKAYT
jgi:hypothetical protein